MWRPLPIMLNDAQRFGRESEAAAARYLQRAGYRVMARNYRTRVGEIDLVAYDGSVLAFVEVKARRSDRFGAPEAAVTTDKQRRLTKAALAYLASLEPPGGARGRVGRVDPPTCRFDLVIVEQGAAGGPASGRIELLKDIFSPDWDGL